MHLKARAPFRYPAEVLSNVSLPWWDSSTSPSSAHSCFGAAKWGLSVEKRCGTPRVLTRAHALDITQNTVYTASQLMLSFQPKSVTKDLLASLPERSRKVLTDRFGLSAKGESRTLDAIG